MAAEPINKDEVTILIDKGCSFQGRLAFEGTARIAGTCSGEILSPDVLIIEQSANVDAQMKASEVIIYGVAKGRIEATEQVRIAEGGVFHGDIVSPCLHVSEGADFQGYSSKPQMDSTPNPSI